MMSFTLPPLKSRSLCKRLLAASVLFGELVILLLPLARGLHLGESVVLAALLAEVVLVSQAELLDPRPVLAGPQAKVPAMKR